MAADGHAVTLLAGRGGDALPGVDSRVIPLLDSRNERILEVKRELDAGMVTKRFGALQADIAGELRPLFEGFDCVVVHNVCSLHKNLALTTALHSLSREPSGPAFVAWHHDFAWLSEQYAGELHPGEPWDQLRRAWPGVRQVTISKYRAGQWSDLAGIPREGIAVVPNGIDLAAFFGIVGDLADLAKRLRLFDRGPILLAPVRVTRRKNLQLAVRALAELRLSYPNAALVVTGPPGAHNPANEAYLEDLLTLTDELGLRDHVVFLAEELGRPLSDAEVAACYRLADALLLTSEEEGFGLPVIESAVAGLPILCTDIPPLRELAGNRACYFAPGAAPTEVAGIVAGRIGGDGVTAAKVFHRSSYSWDGVYAAHIAPLLASMEP
jgi:glycosyltransferase involved in cell wall biosynthesis